VTAATNQPTEIAAAAGGRPRWVGPFVLLSAIWGASFAFIKVAVDAGVAPIWVALWRCLFGAVALWLVCLVRREPIVRDRRTWLHSAIVALILNSVPYTLLAFGETKISSVLAGVWNAVTPLMTIIFVLLLVREEKLTLRRVAGMLAGFVGVLVVLGVWHGVHGGLLIGSLACLGATTCYGLAYAYMRRFLSGRSGSAAMLSAAQVTCGTIELALVAPLLSGAPTWPGVGAGFALIALGALGTGIAFILNFSVIRAAGPTIASSVTYVVPLWSTALGALVLSEPVGWNTVVGGVIVIAGVVFASGRRR
jgi:drug/metabolite transporter (DMT)-like permease